MTGFLDRGWVLNRFWRSLEVEIWRNHYYLTSMKLSGWYLWYLMIIFFFFWYLTNSQIFDELLQIQRILSEIQRTLGDSKKLLEILTWRYSTVTSIFDWPLDNRWTLRDTTDSWRFDGFDSLIFDNPTNFLILDELLKIQRTFKDLTKS